MPLHDFRLLTPSRLTFGGGDGTPAADALRKQRRKLAVLANLGLERSPIPRDSLVEMFRGDEDEARARHSLSDGLSHLRRVLTAGCATAGKTLVERAFLSHAEDEEKLADPAFRQQRGRRGQGARRGAGGADHMPGAFWHSTFVKAVGDTERRIMAIAAELHSDEEAALLEDGSAQANLWGINLSPQQRSRPGNPCE